MFKGICTLVILLLAGCVVKPENISGSDIGNNSCDVELKKYISMFDAGNKAVAFEIGIIQEVRYWACGAGSRAGNKAEAVKYYEIAADLGNRKAAINFGHAVLNSNVLDRQIVSEKTNKAISILEAIPPSEDYRAYTILGHYYNSYSPERRSTEAITKTLKYYEPAALEGDAIVQMQLKMNYGALQDKVNSYAWGRILQMRTGDNFTLNSLKSGLLDAEVKKGEERAFEIVSKYPKSRSARLSGCFPWFYKYNDIFPDGNEKAVEYARSHCSL